MREGVSERRTVRCSRRRWTRRRSRLRARQRCQSRRGGRARLEREEDDARKATLLSNGTARDKGDLLRKLMKLRQTGRRMKTMSTWRTKADARAIT